MTPEEKINLIEKFNNASGDFDYTLKLNNEIIHFRPFEDAWTIIEQLIHCVDFETANFHRYRWAISVPGTKVLSFDGNIWKEALKYMNADMAQAISLIKAVRYFMSTHLRQIVNEDWTKYIYAFSESKSFNLESALKNWADHTGFHKELIDRNIKLFSEQK